jgi:hypothetical protein
LAFSQLKEPPTEGHRSVKRTSKGKEGVEGGGKVRQVAEEKCDTWSIDI